MFHQNLLIIPFDDNRQRDAVLKVLWEHNDRLANPHKYPVDFVRYNEFEPYELTAPGSELMGAELVSFFKHEGIGGGVPLACHGPVLRRGVIFGNGSDTIDNNQMSYLQWHLLHALAGVYRDGMPAVTAYVCDELVKECLNEGRKIVAEEKLAAVPEVPPSGTIGMVRSARWCTRSTVGNPDFRDLMMELEPGQTRTQRMNQNPHITPYLSRYVCSMDGWMACGRYFPNDNQDEAHAYAQLLLETPSHQAQ